MWIPLVSATNLVVLVADDLGADKLAFTAGVDGWFQPETPVLDALASDGLVFTEAWAAPVCSPTRASLLTGLYAHHHGVGSTVADLSAAEALSTDTTTLAEVLHDAGYATGMFGKWHLGTLGSGGAGWSSTRRCAAGADAWSEDANPLLHGFDHYVGFLGGEPEDYASWTRVDADPGSGTACVERTHPDVVANEEALAWVAAQTGPFFAVVAYAMPHSDSSWGSATYEADDVPADCAVNACVDAGTCGDLDSDGVDDADAWIYAALVACLDTRVGELLDGLPADTIVVFLGDNGTPGNQAFGDDVTEAPFRGSVSPRTGAGRWGKGSPFRSGVRVPLVVSGPGVRRGSSSHPVLVADLFATLTELLGVEGAATDGESFADCLDRGFTSCAVGLPDARPFYVEAWTDAQAVAALRGDRYTLRVERDGECLAPTMQANSDLYDEVDLYAALPLAAARLKRGFHALDADWLPRGEDGLVRFCW